MSFGNQRGGRRTANKPDFLDPAIGEAMKIIPLIAFAASMMCPIAGAAQVEDCALSARIVPAKEAYVFQEPIRLDVTLLNRGNASAAVVLILPYLNGQFTLTDKHHALRAGGPLIDPEYTS